jgi:hypothetical protein
VSQISSFPRRIWEKSELQILPSDRRQAWSIFLWNEKMEGTYQSASADANDPNSISRLGRNRAYSDDVSLRAFQDNLPTFICFCILLFASENGISSKSLPSLMHKNALFHLPKTAFSHRMSIRGCSTFEGKIWKSSLVTERFRTCNLDRFDRVLDDSMFRTVRKKNQTAGKKPRQDPPHSKLCGGIRSEKGRFSLGKCKTRNIVRTVTFYGQKTIHRTIEFPMTFRIGRVHKLIWTSLFLF